VKHEISIEGYIYRLRPIGLEDAGFVVELRTDVSLGKYLHSTSTKISDQENYIRNYYERIGDYYFVVERIETRQREGLIAIYDIDDKEKTAEWGRWIIKKGSMAAVESALLIYRIAFEMLGLDTVYCRTVMANKSTVSFHDSTGVSRYRIMKNNVKLSNGVYDSIEHRMRKEEWLEVKMNLEDKVVKLSRLQGQDNQEAVL